MAKERENSKKKEVSKPTIERAKKLEQMMFSKHWQITTRVFGITLGIVGIFATIGYLIDQRLASSPIGLIAAILLSYPLSQFLVYKVFKKITKK